MKTIFVDDETWMLQQFNNECEDIEEIELLGSFVESRKALEFAENNEVELAFLDIEMPGMNGFELSEKLREVNPDMVIIFISAYDEYMNEALTDKEADYYIVKPYRREQLKKAVDRASLLYARHDEHVRIETFGRFSVYVDGSLLRITSPKAKELLAMLVDKRGTVLGAEEAFYMLWENRIWNHDNAKSFYKVLKKLCETLEDANIPEIVEVAKGEYRLDTSKVQCDYYDFIDRKPYALEKYNGEYMSEYSWGEYTVARLDKLLQEKQAVQKP